ncbi:MAG: hypothetical protein ACLFVU_09015 [Phycisphaerae bacterium]
MRRILQAVAVLCLLSPAAVMADKVTKINDNLVRVTVVGMGESEEEAIRDAKRKAVETGAGTVIYSHSETKDFTLVKDTVLARATGFVQSFKQLAKNETEDGIVEIKAEVVVSVRGVEDMWGTVTNLLTDMGRPKVMVFVTETIGGKRIDDSTVQTRIENLLLKSGFQLVNKEQIKAINQKDLLDAVASDNVAKVQAIAKRFGAQLFISGTAKAVSGGVRRMGGLTLHAYEAEANIKCYRADTAQLLSAVPGSPTRGVQRVANSAAKQALDLQAKKIAPKVQLDILRFWQDALAGRGEVVLEISGVSFRDYLKIKKALKKLKDVKDVSTKYSNKIARSSIQSSINAEKLAEKVVEVLENLEITDISQNVIKGTWASE